jgi:hypothetical protein
MLLGGFLMDQYGWSLAALFILCGCIVLLCTVLTLFVADPEGIAPPDTPAFWRRLARKDPELLQKLEREKAEKKPAGGESIGKCIGGTCPNPHPLLFCLFCRLSLCVAFGRLSPDLEC